MIVKGGVGLKVLVVILMSVVLVIYGLVTFIIEIRERSKLSKFQLVLSIILIVIGISSLIIAIDN